MPTMKVSVLHGFTRGDSDHKIAPSAMALPDVGAPVLLKEECSSPSAAIEPFCAIGFHSSEGSTTSGYCEEPWPSLIVAPSPDSSTSSVLTPAEDLLYPSSTCLGLPLPNGPFQPSLCYPKPHELHHLAAEVGMQSPASYYPNSPTDSFTELDAHLLPTSSIPTSSPAIREAKGIAMDISSAVSSVAIPVIATGPSRPNNNDRPYAQLLRDCFLSRPDHSMALKEIYKWFEQNTTKANQPGKGWQNSIRHNLSMNAAFRKQDSSHTHLNAGTDRGLSRSRSNVWTMEPWAVEGRVQSTTRYRKSSSSRRASGHRSARQQQQQQRQQQQHRSHNYGQSNYVLSGNEFSHGRVMDRAAAGRRGGVASRQCRERQQAELQNQRGMGILHQSMPSVPVGSNSWNIPRACSPELMASLNVPGHFRMGSTNPSVTGYIGLPGGVHMGHAQMYGPQIPGTVTSPALGMGNNSHSSAAAAHISPTQGHQHVPMGCVRVPSGQVSPEQHQQAPPGQQQPQHHQHNGGFAFGSPVGAGDFTSASDVHSVHHHHHHHPATPAAANPPSFGPMNGGSLKDWGGVGQPSAAGGV